MNPGRLSLLLGFALYVAGRFLRAARRPALVLLVLLLVYVVADVTARWELEREIARLRAEGAPVTLAEVAPPPVPDSENAALLYERAFARLPRLERRDSSDPTSDLRLSDADAQVLFDFFGTNREKRRAVSLVELRRVVVGTEDALALVREAAAMPRCRFPVDWEAGKYATFPHLALLRSLYHLLGARAIVMAQEGRHPEACADLEAMFGIARHIGAEPALISQFRQYDCLSAFGVSLQRVLGTGPLEEGWSRLDEALAAFDLYGRFESAMKTEYAGITWAFDAVREDPGQFLCNLGSEGGEGKPALGIRDVIRPLFEPVLKRDQARFLRRMSEWIELARRRAPVESNLPEERSSGMPWHARMTYILFYPVPQPYQLNDFMVKRDEAIARLALTRCALALEERRRLLSEGFDPRRVALAKPLPDDPHTGRPFRYRMHGTGYVLYSVGANRRDDGGFHRRDRPLNLDLPRGEEDDIAWSMER